MADPPRYPRYPQRYDLDPTGLDPDDPYTERLDNADDEAVLYGPPMDDGADYEPRIDAGICEWMDLDP